MQALIEMENLLDRQTLYAKEMLERSNKHMIKELSYLRKIPLEVLEEAGVFWVDKEVEMLLPNFLEKPGELVDFGIISPTNNRPIFHQRWVFPIKNANGKVINFVGYSNLVDERYVYGTGKYYDRTEVLYGLEHMREAYKQGYAIVTEGITDSLAVRGLGFKGVFAWCGTSDSKYKIKVLNRCRHGVIRVPDRDAAGDKTQMLWQFNRYFTIVTNLRFKDSAEMISDSEEMAEYYKECMESAIDWIKQKEHKGTKCAFSSGNM